MEHAEAGRQWPVAEIRFCKAEDVGGLARSALQCEVQRLAITHEIICRVVQSKEAAAITTHATGKANGVLALLLYLQIDINPIGFRPVGSWACLRIRFLLGIFILKNVKETQLIKPKQTDIHQLSAEELAFVDHHFAPDNLVASRGIAHEIEPS